MAPRLVDREQKRRELIDAALRVFVERGFAATKVADIASAAGVGKGTLYEYFSAKEELFFAVVEGVHARTVARVDEVLARTGSPRLQLVHLLDLAGTLVTEHLAVHAVTLDFWAASRGSAFEGQFLEATRASYEHYRELVADVLRRGHEAGEFRADVSADGLAALLVGAIDGLGNQKFFDRSLDPNAAVRAFATVFLAGLCQEAG
jgi:AcrR family transcriptional regulator